MNFLPQQEQDAHEVTSQAAEVLHQQQEEVQQLAREMNKMHSKADKLRRKGRIQEAASAALEARKLGEKLSKVKFPWETPRRRVQY